MRVPALLLFCLASSGCGLLASGTTTIVPIRSEPSGAEVWVDGVRVGETPLRVALRSEEPHRVELRRSGFVPRALQFEPVIDASYVILDVATVFVGLLIDAATGGYYELRPDRLAVRLSRDPRGLPQRDGPVGPEDAVGLSTPPPNQPR